ncbi:MAG TPA: hypothetical protein VHN99_04285 [Deinococcales bacterium]|nr:hypothetical protein [Deinococcales bacterium]
MEVEERLRRFFRTWYRVNGRAFPWRQRETTPFGHVVAEVMLRQTKASMVVAPWTEFTQRFPSPTGVVQTPAEEILALVAPLGLGRQRTGALKSLSLALVERHRGRVPRGLEQLRELPHLGLYSAGAVACFAFGQRVPIVDVNVLRVLGRITGEVYPADNRWKKAGEAWELAGRILPARGFREHNYGLLDFAAQVCTARRPLCEACPLLGVCTYGRLARSDVPVHGATRQVTGPTGPVDGFDRASR